jgi:tRNA nucleotidyltransferase (CCA-adding enzyme)
MQIYLVGGAVRDRLLNYPVIENDWVVVGATPEDMLANGFHPVGKDFPVFLHPETHEEYALARTERKSGRGYTGFTFYASPEVSLEEDLRRRDLTINAIAMTKDGKIIDPYGGQDDIRLRILRHVSPAFIEDPVRILRVARFMARYHDLGFTIADETKQLMKQMVEAGEVDALIRDRVWHELDSALGEKNPLQFFHVLDECGALAKLFPGFKQHVDQLINNSNNPKEIYVARLLLPFSEQEIRDLCRAYPVPTAYRDLALLANQLQTLFSQSTLTAEEILQLINATDAWRRKNRFLALLAVFKDHRHQQTLKSAYTVANQISAKPFIAQGLSGKKLGEAVQAARLEAIKTSLIIQ